MEEIKYIVKAREVLRDLIEVAPSVWKWFLSISWRKPSSIISHFAVVLIAFFIAVWAIRTLLELLLSLRDALIKTGIWFSGSSSMREMVRRRQQFCRMIRGDIDQLNKREAWNDQFYTDLEAEVEAEGWYYATRFDQLIRRKSLGLRRIGSLMKAIETSAEKTLLLVGEPGSGKSVALRHLAHQMTEQGVKSQDPRTRIPLYVNLKELPAPPITGPTTDWIKEFVIDNVRRGDADTADYIRQNWKAHLENGIWVFLFDSFDEIPMVLHSPQSSPTVREHAEAIRLFLDSMNDCRGLLASREFKGPENLPWQKFRILSLSTKRQEELIQNTFLESAQKETVRRHLAMNTGTLHGNPLYLSLLCRYVRRTGAPPTNDYDLLLSHLEQLANRDPDYTLRQYGYRPFHLLEKATEIAVHFALNPSLSLAPTYDEIAEAMGVPALGRIDFDRLLAALVDVKIGRVDVPEARAGDRRFTFSHRRYQETLFVRHLEHRPEVIPASELLSDSRLREYAVALLQTGSLGTIGRLTKEAIQILNDIAINQKQLAVLPGYGAVLGYYDWKSDKLSHLLALLQEGLGRRMNVLSVSLSEAIEQVLGPRWNNGDWIDRGMVLKLGGLLPRQQLEQRLEWAVQYGTAALQEQAFRTVVYLQTATSRLHSWFAGRLSKEALFIVDRAERLRLEALCARLPESIGAKHILRRAHFFQKLTKGLIPAARIYGQTIYDLNILKFNGQRVDRSMQYRIGLLTLLFYLNIATTFSVFVTWKSTGEAYKWRWVSILPMAWAFLVSVIYVGRSQRNRLTIQEILRSAFDVRRPGTRNMIFGYAVLLATLCGWLFAREFFQRVINIMGGLLFLFLAIGVILRIKQFKDKRKYITRFYSLCEVGSINPLLAESLPELLEWLTFESTNITGGPVCRSLSCMLLHFSKNLKFTSNDPLIQSLLKEKDLAQAIRPIQRRIEFLNDECLSLVAKQIELEQPLRE